MVQVAGKRGASGENCVEWQKALFIDLVYLQQFAFGEVDAEVPLARHKQLLREIHEIATRSFDCADMPAARTFFTDLTDQYKNLNYAPEGSHAAADLTGRIAARLAEGR